MKKKEDSYYSDMFDFKDDELFDEDISQGKKKEHRYRKIVSGSMKRIIKYNILRGEDALPIDRKKVLSFVNYYTIRFRKASGANKEEVKHLHSLIKYFYRKEYIRQRQSLVKISQHIEELIGGSEGDSSSKKLIQYIQLVWLREEFFVTKKQILELLLCCAPLVPKIKKVLYDNMEKLEDALEKE